MLIALLLFSAFYAKTVNMPPRRPAAPPALSACATVTRADVEAALGRRVGEGTEETAGASSTCDYRNRDGLVSIAVQRIAARPDLHAEIAALKKDVPNAIVRQAPEFGQSAFYFDIPDAGTQLHIIDGGSSHLMISILGLGDPSQVSGAAARIARAALRRL